MPELDMVVLVTFQFLLFLSSSISR